MSTKLKKLATTLVIITILLSLSENVKIAFSDGTGGKIDLFTQKAPYDGKSPNATSEAFSPQELVILYALVTYNDDPVQHLLVAFYVQPPSNMSFTRTAITNSSGIAAINFTIPTPSIDVGENDVLGTWFALAKVFIEGEVFQDTLTFNVDWIIKLISVRTIYENLTYGTNFGKEGDVGLEITLRNIATVVKSATIAIVIQDELDVPISSYEIRDFQVQPNGKLIFLYCKLYIPKWAYAGNATVHVSALTAPANYDGIPYCPEVYTQFSITSKEPLTISLHDVAVVWVAPSAESVEAGQTVDITALVQNEGTETESFNVNAYYNVTLIGTLPVILAPYSHVILNFLFDTSAVNSGNYTISVSIPPLANEADLTDNVFVDGVVEIKSKPPIIVHDIAITDVKVSTSALFIGDILRINVSVVNKGTETEAFTVTAYYDSAVIEPQQVDSLAPNANIKLIFLWDTSLVQEGYYQISAFAYLSNDVDVSDNTFVDGVVQVKTKPFPLLFHDVAVLNVTPSSKSVYIGDTVDISVTVKNLGNYTESFTVQVSYGFGVVETLSFDNLKSGAQKSSVCHWNTQGVSEGNYTISALASSVLGEVNLENNLYIDGIVQVKTRPPPPILYHDVAVVSVHPSSVLVSKGEVVEISVVVENLGNYTESFNVTLFYNSSVVGVALVKNLVSHTKKTLSFNWDTSNVPEGNYTISASANHVSGEVNFGNNLYVDGVVTVSVALTGLFVPDWFYWFLLLLLLLLLFLLFVLLYRRRKKKKEEEAFHSGWTAWYYGYDLRGKSRRI